MDANNPRYADGSVVREGDIVELDKVAATQSYAGYAKDMDSLIGLKLLVKRVGCVRFYNGSDVAIIDLAVPICAEALGDPSVQRTLDYWSYSSDMFVLSQERDVDMTVTAGLTEFLDGV